MYKTIEESVRFIHQLAPAAAQTNELIYLAVPYTAIRSAAEAAKNTRIAIGAQNMHEAFEGAFTGEVSGRMLATQERGSGRWALNGAIFTTNPIIWLQKN